MFNQIVNLVSENPIAERLIIISPYITIRPVKAIVRILSDRTKIDVITDFSYDNFLNGSSTLGAFMFLSKRAGVRISTVDNLHAKAYIWGDKALIGSANFTDRGLGFSLQPNLEILSLVRCTDKSLVELLMKIDEKKRHIETGEIVAMLTRLSNEKTGHRVIIKKRLDSILLHDNWLPSCSLRYLLQYLRDGSLYKVPLISRNKISDDAYYLESKSKISLDALNPKAFLEKILEIPIIQLAVECRLRGDNYLVKCLRARHIGLNQIDALDNWSEFCIMNTISDSE